MNTVSDNSFMTPHVQVRCWKLSQQKHARRAVLSNFNFKHTVIPRLQIHAINKLKESPIFHQSLTSHFILSSRSIYIYAHVLWLRFCILPQPTSPQPIMHSLHFAQRHSIGGNGNLLYPLVLPVQSIQIHIAILVPIPRLCQPLTR